MECVKRAVVLVMAFMAMPFLEIQAAEDILINSASGFGYKYLGCYKDRSSPSYPRALPVQLKSAKNFTNWKIEGYNFKKVIDVCAERARARGLSLFGVQFWGECWGGEQGTRYSSYGAESRPRMCFKGIGGSWTNAVYKLISECNVKNVTYKDGDSFYIPQNPINYNDIDCKVCSCDRGATTCPNKAKCDVFHKVPCEKLIPAPQGKCCPTCACYHNNIDYKDGQTWVNRQPNDCFQCTCVSSETKCEVVKCPENCRNPVYEPGKCCPTCSPGAPVTEAPFTIPETTTRPPPVFPPFAGFPGNHKRSLKMKKKSKRSYN